MLEDEADAPFARRLPAHIATVEAHLAPVGILEAGDDPQQRRLSRTRRPEQRDEPSVRDIEADVVERRETPELLDHVANGDAHLVPLSKTALRHSTALLTTRVASASSAKSEATANAGTN